MELVGVRVELPANTPMVLLQETVGERRLVPIYIGGAEAAAIHYALEGVVPPRPLTHDLLCTVIADLGATCEKVVITQVIDHTFYAELHLRRDDAHQVADQTDAERSDADDAPNNGVITVSCRPSDAIALAARVGCPIMATDELLDEVGQIPEPEVEDDEEIIDEFKDFIENISPDDFAS